MHLSIDRPEIRVLFISCSHARSVGVRSEGKHRLFNDSTDFALGRSGSIKHGARWCQQANRVGCGGSYCQRQCPTILLECGGCWLQGASYNPHTCRSPPSPSSSSSTAINLVIIMKSSIVASLLVTAAGARTITVKNGCSFTIWPAMVGNPW